MHHAQGWHWQCHLGSSSRSDSRSGRGWRGWSHDSPRRGRWKTTGRGRPRRSWRGRRARRALHRHGSCSRRNGGWGRSGGPSPHQRSRRRWGRRPSNLAHCAAPGATEADPNRRRSAAETHAAGTVARGRGRRQCTGKGQPHTAGSLTAQSHTAGALATQPDTASGQPTEAHAGASKDGGQRIRDHRTLLLAGSRGLHLLEASLARGRTTHSQGGARTSRRGPSGGTCS